MFKHGKVTSKGPFPGSVKTLRRFFDSCSDQICYLLVIRKEINQITAEDNLITATTALHPVKLRRDMQHAAALKLFI